MNTVVIYCRVSTKEQGDSKLGLDAQESVCKQYAESNDIAVMRVYQEVTSGTVPLTERAVFMEALNKAVDTGSILLVAKQDRISRDEYIWHGLHNNHTFGKRTPKLIVVDSPNASTFELSIKASLAAEERRLISERTKKALNELKKQGVDLGKAGREAIAANRNDTTEAKATIVRLKGEYWSYRLIALELNKRGLLNSQGKPWTEKSVEQYYRKYRNEKKNDSINSKTEVLAGESMHATQSRLKK